MLLNIDTSSLNLPTLAVSALVIGLSSMAFAVFAGNFALVLRASRNLADLFQGLIIACTGAIIPLTLLPLPFQWLSQILPLASGLPALRAAVTGASLDAVASTLAREALVGVVYAGIGTALFLVFEWQAKRAGSLEWEPA